MKKFLNKQMDKVDLIERKELLQITKKIAATNTYH